MGKSRERFSPWIPHGAAAQPAKPAPHPAPLFASPPFDMWEQSSSPCMHYCLHYHPTAAWKGPSTRGSTHQCPSTSGAMTSIQTSYLLYKSTTAYKQDLWRKTPWQRFFLLLSEELFFHITCKPSKMTERVIWIPWLVNEVFCKKLHAKPGLLNLTSWHWLLQVRNHRWLHVITATEVLLNSLTFARMCRILYTQYAIEIRQPWTPYIQDAPPCSV